MGGSYSFLALLFQKTLIRFQSDIVAFRGALMGSLVSEIFAPAYGATIFGGGAMLGGLVMVTFTSVYGA